MYRAADCYLHTQLTAKMLSLLLLTLMGQGQPGREEAGVQKQQKYTSELEFGDPEGGMELGAFPCNHLMSEWRQGCSVAHLE